MEEAQTEEHFLGTEQKLSSLLECRTPGLLEAVGKFAVLVPLVRGTDGYSILYEVRAGKLRRQPGEVCFPGGKMERDETPVAAALRETGEELGLEPGAVRVLGQLDFLAPRGNSILYPVLGLVEEESLKKLTLNPAEVETVFRVPLDWLLNAKPKEYRYRLIPDMDEDFPYEQLGITSDYHWQIGRESGPIYPWEGKIIWGMTARITRHLLEVWRTIL